MARLIAKNERNRKHNERAACFKRLLFKGRIHLKENHAYLR